MTDTACGRGALGGDYFQRNACHLRVWLLQPWFLCGPSLTTSEWEGADASEGGRGLLLSVCLAPAHPSWPSLGCSSSPAITFPIALGGRASFAQ